MFDGAMVLMSCFLVNLLLFRIFILLYLTCIQDIFKALNYIIIWEKKHFCCLITIVFQQFLGNELKFSKYIFQTV